jgi:NADPH:quinone reductase-like Zn-dependent oxidoreductase
LNLDDLERVTGGNMAVRPDLPYSPGMETMGIVAACGAGTEAMMGKRVAAASGQLGIGLEFRFGDVAACRFRHHLSSFATAFTASFRPIATP